MRITNKTQWQTKQIAALIRRVAQDELDAGQLKRARVTILYRWANASRLGDCYVGTPKRPWVLMRLFLPKPTQGPLDTIRLANTIAHELAHAKGMRHRDGMLRTARYYEVGAWRELYSYASAFPVELAPVRITPRPAPLELCSSKLERARGMVSKWQRKIKADTTRLKGWQRKLRYQERRLAAMKAPSTFENHRTGETQTQ